MRLHDWSLGYGDALREAFQSFSSWDAFEMEWLQAAIKRGTVTERGTLEESRAHLDEARRRSLVWESIPGDKRRETYLYLKGLSRQEQDAWYLHQYERLSKQQQHG